jgi:hypothetical protein
VLNIPPRQGARPKTFDGIPHQQLDQNPPDEVYRALLERFLSTAETTSGPSLISVPGARALFLECEGCEGDVAFLRGTEFAHVHPPFDGSFHAVMSPSDCASVIDLGWGELHPWAKCGRIQPNVVMIYAPRDASEIDVVLHLIERAKAHALSRVSGSVLN